MQHLEVQTVRNKRCKCQQKCPSLTAQMNIKVCGCWWLMWPLCFILNWTSFSGSIQWNKLCLTMMRSERLPFLKFLTFPCMFVSWIFSYKIILQEWNCISVMLLKHYCVCLNLPVCLKSESQPMEWTISGVSIWSTNGRWGILFENNPYLVDDTEKWYI